MARIGLTGLGTMGAALALNMAENGFRVAVHNRSSEKTDGFMASAGDLAGNLTATYDLETLVASIDSPRTVVIMVKAGAAVDAVIGALVPLLDAGDLIVDAGNADFNDNRRRTVSLSEEGLKFIGMGV